MKKTSTFKPIIALLSVLLAIVVCSSSYLDYRRSSHYPSFALNNHIELPIIGECAVENSGLEQRDYELFMKDMDLHQAESAAIIGSRFSLINSTECAQIWLKYAASKNNKEAMFQLGRSYLNHDRLASLAWYEEAAERGHAEALYFAGHEYALGQIVKVDLRLSSNMIEQSCELGFKPACEALTVISALNIIHYQNGL